GISGQRYASDGSPKGSEFQVNTYTTFSQYRPAVAASSSGDFVVVWMSGGSASTDVSSYSIQARRYASDGAPLGNQFQVNTYTTNKQFHPAVAVDGEGSFTVVWASTGSADSDTSGDSIHLQRYASDGTPLGGEFRVNTFTTGGQGAPSVASDAAGDFVIVWDSADQDGNGRGVFGQRYSTSGAPLGDEFLVNTTTTSGDQDFAAVSSDAQGNFVVVWNTFSFVPTGGGRRFSSTGEPLGEEFEIPGGYPGVSFDGTGGFIVVWQAGSPFLDVFAQRFASDGTPRGPAFQVNTYTSYDQKYPAVASDQYGDFMVVWESVQEDGSNFGIFGRRFDATGAPFGTDFRVNTYTTQGQYLPTIASSPIGNVVVTWDSTGEDGTLYGAYGQRFTFVAGDANGDGVLDVLDVFYLINALFAGGSSALGSADVNGDGIVDVRDVFYLINFLFAGGPAPKI
ncbi:MAG TPA: dockerin type I repeat-containing protein, partial [Thermoanaerobaculia bacterium]|nr:dockerin type I repeat-containing protein [Thermoanaerobaculia bacterium]